MNELELYDGEYLNDKRSGKNYLCNGKIKFDGEYLNRKGTWKGLEYEKLNGRLIYTGRYANGKKTEQEQNIITIRM